MLSPRPKITWTEALEGSNRELCPAEKQVLAQITGLADAIGSWDKNKDSSFAKFFREGFRAGLQHPWVQNFLLVPTNRKKSSAINFMADGVLTFQDCSCGYVHQIRVEISFDNRQIIGTNVLKMLLDPSARPPVERRSLGILICPSKESKTEFGLDASVASADEYLLAIESGYSQFVSIPILLGVVRTA